MSRDKHRCKNAFSTFPVNVPFEFRVLLLQTKAREYSLIFNWWFDREKKMFIPFPNAWVRREYSNHVWNLDITIPLIPPILISYKHIFNLKLYNNHIVVLQPSNYDFNFRVFYCTCTKIWEEPKGCSVSLLM